MHPILLPNPAMFELISYSLDQNKVLNLEVRTKGGGAKCPDCHRISDRIHSHYSRTIQDLPMADLSVILHVCVRRFFCDTPSCYKCTFTERMPGSIESYARRTNRMLNSQREVGFVAGGEGGSKIVHKLALPTSPDTLIRLVRIAPILEKPTPKKLGIDDWAFRRGHSYGTILIDLETHRPVDLLPDRTVDTVKKWLLEHPGVEIVTRDRSPIYIEAINQGAASAIQVADRWHLLHNLVETIERTLNRRYKDLQAAFRKTIGKGTEAEKPAKKDLPVSSEQNISLTGYEKQRQQMREKRQAQFEEIHQLKQRGLSIRAISCSLRIGREKVRKNLANEQPPEYKRRRQKTILTPYWAHLEKRWTSGCRNGMKLWREIQGMGYSGSYGSMARQVASLRKRMPREKTHPPSLEAPVRQSGAQDQVRPYSVRQTAWLFVKDRDQIEGKKSQYLVELLDSSEDFQRLYGLVQEFWKIVRERKQDQLGDWLIRSKNSGIMELKNFVLGLEKDLKAVEASLNYEWSNGPVEGHNNRLKMIKRQMYGRANFDLLRQRVLYDG